MRQMTLIDYTRSQSTSNEHFLGSALPTNPNQPTVRPRYVSLCYNLTLLFHLSEVEIHHRFTSWVDGRIFVHPERVVHVLLLLIE